MQHTALRRVQLQARAFGRACLLCLCAVTFGLAPVTVSAQSMSSLISGQKQVDDLMLAARQATDAGQFDDATSYLQQILGLDANNVEAHFRIGVIFWQRQQIQQALGYFQRSSDLAPNNASLHLSVGGYFEQINLLPQALQHYRAALPLLEGTPEFKNAEKRTNLALVKDYAAHGDMDSSLQLLNSLVDEYPDDARVLQHLAFSYVIANRFDDALRVYRTVLEREPNNDTAHLNVAGVYEKLGDFPSALIELQRVIDLNADKGRVNEARARMALINAAQWDKQDNAQQAIAELNTVVDSNPGHPLVNMQLATLYRKLQQFPDAEKALLRIITANPNELQARLKLAELYLERKNYIDAVWEMEWVNVRGANTPLGEQAKNMLAQLTQAFGQQVDGMRNIALQKNQFKQRITANADDVEAHFNLGVILMNQEQYEEARVEFEEARRLDPSIVRVHSSLSDIYSQLGRFGDAADAILRFVSLETNLENVERIRLNIAGLVGQKLYEEKQYDASLYQFRRVLDEVPDDAMALFFSGLILSQQGKLEDAAKSYERVIDKIPTHMGARTNVAMLYEQLGKEEDALTQYRRIALAAPPGPMKESAEKRAVLLQRAVNGFTSSAGYSLNFDGNANLNDAHPSPEYSSSLTGTLTYRYKYDDDTRLGMSLTPTYTTYHIGLYDYLTEAVEPFVTYGPPERSYSLRYNHSQVSGVLNEMNVNTQQSISLETTRVAFGDKQISGNATVRSFKSAQNPNFDSRAYNLKGDYVRALSQGANDVFSIALGYNAGVHNLSNPGSPPGSGATEFYYQNVLNYLVGSTDDSEYVSGTLTYQYNKFLSSNVSLGATFNYGYTSYINPDRFSCDRRRNQSYALSLSMNYRFSESIRGFMTGQYNMNESNLPTYVVARGAGTSPTLLCSGLLVPPGYDFVPYSSEQLIGVPLQSTSLSNYSKTTLTIGIGVNF